MRFFPARQYIAIDERALIEYSGVRGTQETKNKSSKLCFEVPRAASAHSFINFHEGDAAELLVANKNTRFGIGLIQEFRGSLARLTNKTGSDTSVDKALYFQRRES